MQDLIAFNQPSPIKFIDDDRMNIHPLFLVGINLSLMFSDPVANNEIPFTYENTNLKMMPIKNALPYQEERKQINEEEKEGMNELSIFERMIDDAGSNNSKSSSHSASKVHMTLAELLEAVQSFKFRPQQDKMLPKKD
jgi:hypothetical protein